MSYKENAGWQFNDIKKIIHEQNEKLNRELEMINMNQILRLKNTVSETIYRAPDKKMYKMEEISTNSRTSHLKFSNQRRTKKKILKKVQNACWIMNTNK